MSINVVLISGNLVSDPEIRFAPTGLAILDGTLANNRSYKKDGETIKDTCFISWVAFGKQAEYYADKLSKGMPVTIEGQLKQDNWEVTDDNGAVQKRTKHKLTVKEIVFPYSNSGNDRTEDTGSSPTQVQESTTQPQAASEDVNTPF